MRQGTIVELTVKNSGFIKHPDSRDPLFFHADHLLGITFKSLSVGDTLKFAVRDTNKGPYAIDISKVEN